MTMFTMSKFATLFGFSLLLLSNIDRCTSLRNTSTRNGQRSMRGEKNNHNNRRNRQKIGHGILQHQRMLDESLSTTSTSTEASTTEASEAEASDEGIFGIFGSFGQQEDEKEDELSITLAPAPAPASASTALATATNVIGDEEEAKAESGVLFSKKSKKDKSSIAGVIKSKNDNKMKSAKLQTQNIMLRGPEGEEMKVKCPLYKEELELFDETGEHLCFKLMENMTTTPSLSPSISHYPSFSMAPSMSPSISSAPTTTHFPSRMPKKLECRQRFPTSVPTVSPKPTTSSLPSFITAAPSIRVVPAVDNVTTLTTNSTEQDAMNSTVLEINVTISSNSSSQEEEEGEEEMNTNNETSSFNVRRRRRRQQAAAAASKKASKVYYDPETGLPIPKEPKQPEIINGRPARYWDLPFCDELEALEEEEEAEEITTVAIVPPSDVPEQEGAISVRDGCALLDNQVRTIENGNTVEPTDQVIVSYLYEITTDAPTEDLPILTYMMQEDIWRDVTPAVLNCESSRKRERRALQSQEEDSDGILYLLPEPNDAVNFDDACAPSDKELGKNEKCARVVGGMTAIMDKEVPYTLDETRRNILIQVRDQMNNKDYSKSGNGISGARFIGILDFDSTQANNNDGSSNLAAEQIVKQEEEAKEGTLLSSYGTTFVVLSVLGILAVAFLVVRKRKSSELYDVEDVNDFDNDDSDLYSKGSRSSSSNKSSPGDHSTVGTAISSPLSTHSYAISDRSADLNATPLSQAQTSQQQQQPKKRRFAFNNTNTKSSHKQLQHEEEEEEVELELQEEEEFNNNNYSSNKSLVRVVEPDSPQRVFRRLSRNNTDISSPPRSVPGGSVSVDITGRSTVNVHSCTSSMCKICKLNNRNNEPIFVSASSLNLSTDDDDSRRRRGPASPNAKAPTRDNNTYHERAYRTGDTVVL